MINLPLSGQIKCYWCSKKGKDIRFLQESQYSKHKDTQHPQEVIIWRCAACHKEFEKLHGCRCHLPKCKGRKIWEGVAKFKCESCEESFLSQRGLSMHERHRHPAIRNQKRAQSTSRGNTRPVSRASVWSKDETESINQVKPALQTFKTTKCSAERIFPRQDPETNKRQKEAPARSRRRSGHN
uniref:Reverse transcriptase n=1 Tax=Apis cerana TaxID=7461 RepID=V9IH71_APICE